MNGALRQLKQLGAIDALEGTKLTNLGRQMALFPLDPRFSKILLSAKDYGCLYVQLYIKYISFVSWLLFSFCYGFLQNIQITTPST